MSIRVIRHLPDTSDLERLVEYATITRKLGAVEESEVYVSIGGDTHSCLVELWEDENALTEHWNDNAELLLQPRNVRDAPRVEFYRQQYFGLASGTWVPEGAGESEGLVHWPARGAVRVIAQGSEGDPEAAQDFLLADVDSTRREIGCIEYTRYSGVEHPQHQLLLELWENQRVYDAHWNLRTLTFKGGDGPNFVPRAYGTNGIEFYRASVFEHHYGRWLPSQAEERSIAIAWPQ